MTEPAERLDILIIGAGPVGMTLALALAGSSYRVLLVDRQKISVQQDDPRALALSFGARQLLERLGAWPARAATPIDTIHVSHHNGFGRTMIDRNDYDLDALGYVVRYRDLAAALAMRLPEGCVLEETEVDDLVQGIDGIRVRLRQGDTTRQLDAAIVVHAEGTPGANSAIDVREYGQHAIIAEVRTNRPHQRRAWERFTPDGPLALLPLGDEFSVVFTLPPEKADRVIALDDVAFLAALQSQFGNRHKFTAAGPRSRFPLALRMRRQLAQGREVWIGNAAQTLHPVSGQGFNLGLRDAWQLAESLLAGSPDEATLQAYARTRRLDRQGGALFTDSIVRTFSNDFPGLKLIRGLGLLALDLFPPVRAFVTRRMIWGARAWP